MFRHYLVASLRNMAANKPSTAIATIGLSIGITAAILMALVVRNQLSFDHFVPGYERTYMGVSVLGVPGHPPTYTGRTNQRAAALLRLNVPEVESAARLILADKTVYGEGVEMRRGNVAATESLYWADPNVFEVLPLPVLRGDLRDAMKRADGVVLPRATARKYFGRDDIVGQAIAVAGHPMTVRAVIEDLPENGTELQSGIFVSGLASFSGIALAQPDGAGNFRLNMITYLRLKPGADIEGVQRRSDRLIQALWSPPGAPVEAGKPSYAMELVRLDRVNLHDGLDPGAWTRLFVAGLVGVLILLIAVANFVNLTTARTARRALEVGVRKACGAGRSSLVGQFLGESVLTVLFATVVAVVLAEWLLGPVNSFLASGALFHYWRDPAAVAALLAGIALVGVAAGAYPAFILSSFRPAAALKEQAGRSGRGGLVRNALVVAQFAALITFAIAAMVVWQQRVYATSEGLRANVDQVVMVRGGCRSAAFLAEVRKLPGVAQASCSGFELLDNGNSTNIVHKGQTVTLDIVSAALGIFGVYDVRPVAGKLPARTDVDPAAAPMVVLNESAVSRLGFASPQAAIGQRIPQPDNIKGPLVPIVAVVPDFAFYSVERPLGPTAYVPQRGMAEASIRLREGQGPQTLGAIDHLWRTAGNRGPVTRFFVSERLGEQYVGMTRQAQLFAVFSAIAVFLACLGLAGVSLAVIERRIKEIGIRKAMGATSRDAVALLLWQFSRPVLWANLIAWPLAFWLMQRWLAGFAYRIDMPLWPFAAASALALLIALSTVGGQAWAAARQKPVLALRYE
jgi:putative ABC transport system permease protein